LENIAKLEEKINQILLKVRDLENVKKELTTKNNELEKNLKVCRLKIEQINEANLELKSNIKEKDTKVHTRLSDLLGKLEQVESELV